MFVCVFVCVSGEGGVKEKWEEQVARVSLAVTLERGMYAVLMMVKRFMGW